MGATRQIFATIFASQTRENRRVLATWVLVIATWVHLEPCHAHIGGPKATSRVEFRAKPSQCARGRIDESLRKMANVRWHSTFERQDPFCDRNSSNEVGIDVIGCYEVPESLGFVPAIAVLRILERFAQIVRETCVGFTDLVERSNRVVNL